MRAVICTAETNLRHPVHGYEAAWNPRTLGQVSLPLPLPRSVRFALWYSAWVAGTVSLDDTRDAILGADTAHDVVGMPGSAEPVPLILALGRFRAAGATAAGLALPVPGDPLGLAGPGSFNAEAIEAEESVVFAGADVGLVPYPVGSGVAWRYHRAVSRRQVPDPAEADTTLRAAVLAAASDLAELEVARWQPEVADELIALRRSADLNVPRGIAPRALRLASMATRCRTIVDLALTYDGAAVTAREADQRRSALAPLDHAARRGLVAVCSYPWER